MLGLIGIVMEHDFRLTSKAVEAKAPSFRNRLLLQWRFNTLLETSCAKLLSGLQFAHITSLNASKKARSNFFKFVFLSLCRPIFEAHDFLFEFMIARNQRRILYLLRGGDTLGLYQSLLELNEKGVALSRVIRGRNINCGLGKSTQTGDGGNYRVGHEET